MKFTLASAAIAGMIATIAPACAQTGMDFYNQCGTGAEAGFFNRPYCHGYLSGFYSALAATSQLCPQSTPNETQVVMVVQDWLRTHAATLDAPAYFMIRNAILHAWGCRRR
jgi:hypothetical protein